MGYASREKKRKAKAKVNAQVAVSSARRKHNAQTAVRYYLCPVRHDTRCVACGGKLAKGGEMIYRRNGHVKLCLACAERDPLVDWRPSASWETRRKRK